MKIIEWYQNLTDWKYVIYEGIIMGVGMWIAKEGIYPIIEKPFGW